MHWITVTLLCLSSSIVVILAFMYYRLFRYARDTPPLLEQEITFDTIY
jgi:hypothetical protein